MKWSEAKPTEAYDVRHYVSITYNPNPKGEYYATTRWEWGISKMLFGAFRINIGLYGAHTYSVSYFCKPEDSASLWCGAITAMMQNLPEEITEQEIKALFPEQTIKPLSADHRCQEQLYLLANRLARNATERNGQ
jgi:hypothetical protein